MTSYFLSSSKIFLKGFLHCGGDNYRRRVRMQIYSDQPPQTSCHPLSTESLQVYCDTGNGYLEIALANHHTG